MRDWVAIFLLIALTLGGCSSDGHIRAKDTPPQGWQRAVIFNIENRDTTERCDISLMLRCRVAELDETRGSIRLNIVTTTPTQRRVAEQVEVTVISPDVIIERGVALIDQPYRNSVQWRELGEYQMAIYPTQPTDGVESIGVRVTSREIK